MRRGFEIGTKRWRQGTSEDLERNRAEEELNLLQRNSATREIWNCWVNEGTEGLLFQTELKTG